MADIRNWLESLGVGEYADVFEENALEWNHLPELSHEALKELGIQAMGHRITLLKAISSLETGSGEELPGPAGSSSSRPGRSGEAERRQLTIMFADLVGSTELSQRLDPEELREVNRTYQDAAKVAIEEHGGYVARYMGDGVLAYFGYPQAGEDDAERAVQAGLSLVASIPALLTSVRLAARVGIATGPVVVGDLIGEGASLESAVVGETPNLAARLQSEALENQVVISTATRRLVDGLFELKSLGVREIRGFSERQSLWAVHGRRLTPSRFQARHQSALLSLVGRGSELALLQSRWHTAVDGEGQVVLLAGEPGIGKSRLSEAFVRSIGDQDCLIIRYQCTQLHENSAFSPFTHQLQHAGRFTSQDDDVAKLDKLEALLCTSIERSKSLSLFAALLSLSTDRYPTLSLPPEQRKAETISALVAELRALGDASPVLVLFEDAHWVDASSREVLDALIDAVHSLPVLLLVTHRLEFDARWDSHGNVTELRLNRLAQRDGAAIVREIAGGMDLPGDIVRQILERTDGVPLFVEELTKTIVESGALQEGQNRFEHGDSLDPIVIPESLSDSLMARLDRLGAVKEVAQVASVIGRNFTRDLMASISNLDSEALNESLNQLVDSGLISRRNRESSETYEFKHALVRDAAYESLLRRDRQNVHRRIADALRGKLPDQADLEPELLAHHLTEAGELESAIPYWERAGQMAAQTSANSEAIEHLTKGLSLLETFEETEARSEQALDFVYALLSPLSAAKGYSSEEMERAVSRALRLSERTGNTQRLFLVLFGRWSVAYMRGEGPIFQDLAEEFLTLASKEADPTPRVIGFRMLGNSNFARGNVLVSHRNLEAAFQGFENQDLLKLGYAQDLGVSIHSYLSLTCGALGLTEQAQRHTEQALQRARGTDHPNTLGYALGHAAWSTWVIRDFDALAGFAEELSGHAQSHAMPLWDAFGKMFTGAMAGRSDAPVKALSILAEGREQLEKMHAGLFFGFVATLQAEVLISLNRLVEVEVVLQFIDSHMKSTGVRYLEPEYWRLLAQLELAYGDDPQREPENHLRKAVQCAKGQGARLLELRSTTALARLRQAQGKLVEARELLANTYGQFTEGFQATDLIEARALLAELS